MTFVGDIFTSINSDFVKHRNFCINVEALGSCPDVVLSYHERLVQGLTSL